MSHVPVIVGTIFFFWKYRFFSIFSFFQSFEQTVGRPYFVLQCDPEVLFLRRNIIDCVPLLEKAEKLIEFVSFKVKNVKN